MLKRSYISIVLTFIFLLFAGQVHGQSVLDFPRVVSTPETFTGIAIGNPTSQSVSVTFTAYLANGTLLSGAGITNPVTVTLPAGSQLARLFSEIFGNTASFNGWVQATSSTAGLTGFSLNGSAVAADFDGAVAAKPLTQLYLPFVSQVGTGKTEVTIVNVNDEPVNATVVLFDKSGTVMRTKDLNMVPHGFVRKQVPDLFEVDSTVDLSTAAQIRIQSILPLTAYQLITKFQISPTGISRESVAWAAQEVTGAKSTIMPQFVTGGGWLSYLGIVNEAGFEQDVTVTAYREDGKLWNLAQNPKTVTLGGHASLRTTVEDFFGFPPEVLNLGWIEIHSHFGYLIGYVGYGYKESTSFALVAGANAETASKVHVYSHVAEGAGFFTGLTLVNPTKEDATVDLFILRPDGTTIGQTTFTVPAGARIGKLFREFVPASLSQMGGWIFLRSTQPLAGAALFGSTDGAALASVPQQFSTGAFVPPQQTLAAITGSVKFPDGTPVPNMTVVLSGAVNTTTLTDGSGQFIFSQLPAGSYSITVSNTAWIVAPSKQVVSVGLNNVDGVNFQAVSLTPRSAPVIDIVTPSLTIAGTSSFQIAVIGRNFAFDSQVWLNTTALPTKFIDSTHLTATVPGNLVGQQGSLTVAVTVPTPGGGRSNNLTLTVEGTPAATVTAVTVPVGAFPSGVAIHDQQQIALVANEVSDSVSVLDLKALRTIADVRVGRSPSEGIAIDFADNVALVANTGSDTVSVIDLTTYRVTQSIRVGQSPMGIAINSATGRAVVVNGGSDTVSIIDLSSMRVIGTPVRVGSKPASVAINSATNQAVVTNRGSDSVTLIDLGSLQAIDTIPVGSFPRGVAIYSDRNLAVVANGNSNDVSIVDLTRRVERSRVPVGQGPQGVAVNPAAHSAVVTNSGFIKGVFNPAANSSTSASIVNLDWDQAEPPLVTGTAPFGVAISGDTMVIANYGSNDVTIIRPFPNSVPHISAMQPKVFPAGADSLTVNIAGTGFNQLSIARLNGNPLATLFISPTALQAVVTADIVEQVLAIHSAATSANSKDASVAAAITPTVMNITVTTPGPGGGISGTNVQITQITVENEIPVLLSVSPVSASSQSGNLRITLTGNNFNSTSVVNFGSSQYIPSSVTGTSMTVVIPVSELVNPRTVPITVSNPAPGGGTTSNQIFTIQNDAVAPTVTSVVPSTVKAGAAATTFTVTGGGFIAATELAVEGTAVPVKVTGNSITFDLPASAFTSGGTLDGILSNARPNSSAGFAINVLNPIPEVSTVSPNRVPPGNAPVDLRITGLGFVPTSSVTFEETPIQTRFVSPTEIVGTVDPILLVKTRTFHLGVNNPGPGGGQVPAGFFSVEPTGGSGGSGGSGGGTNGGGGGGTTGGTLAPYLSSVFPNLGAQGTSVDVVLTGSNFVSGQTSVRISGPSDIDVLVLNSTSLNGRMALTDPSTTMTVRFTIHSDALLGARNVTVTTPGGTTGGVTFTVFPVGTITGSIRPQYGIVGTVVPVTITGTGFVQGSTRVAASGSGIGVGGINVTSPTSLTTTFTISTDATLGDHTITTTTGTTNSITLFTVLPAGGPTLSSISPTSGVVGNVVTLSLVGSNFVQGATVSVSGAGVQLGSVTVVDSGLIRAPLTINGDAPTGNRSVTVATPNGVSAPQTFTILPVGGTNPPCTSCGPGGVLAPILTGISPAFGIEGTSVDVVLTGRNFIAGQTTVWISGNGDIDVVPLNATAQNASFAVTDPSTTLAVRFVIHTGAASGPRNVTVTTPGGTAGGVRFTVFPTGSNPASISPQNGIVGTVVPVTITGSGFVQGQTTVTASGSGITVGAVNVTNPTTLTTSFSLAANATLGDYTITISTGTTNNVAIFTVLPVGAPTLTSISPVSANSGTSVLLMLGGTNFVPGSTTVSVSGPGVTLGSVTVIDSSSLSAGLTIASVVLTGERNVTVSTPGGTSSSLPFTIVDSGPTSTDPDATLTMLTPCGPLPVALCQTTQFGDPVHLAAVVSDQTRPSLTPNGSVVFTLYNNTLESPNNILVQSPPVPVVNGLAQWPSPDVTILPIGTRIVTAVFSPSDLYAGQKTYGSISNPRDLSTSTRAAFIHEVIPSTPTLISISPNTGTVGSSVGVTLTGTHFVGGATTVSVSGTGITVGTPNVLSTTSLTVTLTIAANASLTARDVTVTTGGGTTSPVTFTVQGTTGGPQPPTLTTVVPNAGVAGNTVSVALTGTNFVVGGTTVAVSGTGITVGTPNVTNANSLTVSFTIAANAAATVRDVTVTTTVGTSNTQQFTVQAPPQPPTLTFVQPNQGAAGSSVDVTLAGTNFIIGGTTVAVTGTGITVGTPNVTSSTSLTVTLTIAANAALTARDVTVTTTAGTSNTQQFTVQSPSAQQPTLTNVQPNTAVAGNAVGVTLTGTNFIIGGTTVAVSGTGITVGTPNVTGPTSLTVTLTIAANAAATARNVTVTTTGGTSNAQTFTVQAPPAQPPTLTDVQPNTGVAGNAVGVTLTGTNFVAGATTVIVSGTGITVGTPNVTSTTSLTVTLTIAANAPATARNVTVTTVGGTSNAQTFTVQAPSALQPTLTNVQPNFGVTGNAVVVTLTGTNFVIGATAVNVSGTGITVGTPNVTSTTSLTVTLTIAANAATTARNVTVTTVGGTSNAQTFTVQAPSAQQPTLTNVQPNTGVPGTSFTATLTGTNFISNATSVVISGSGVSATSISVSDPTTLTATFTVNEVATAGARNVTVTTAGGISNAQTFTVQPPAPTATMSPNAGVAGTSVPVTFTGTDFVPGSTTVSISGTGVTITLGSGTTTSLSATFNIDSAADLGTQTVTLTTPNGTTSGMPFTILPPGSQIGTIQPVIGFVGTTVPVTITGTGFVPGVTTVTTDGGGLSSGPVVVTGPTTLTTTLTIAPDADLGDHIVTVTTNGTDIEVIFTVLTPNPPVLTTIRPASGVTGTLVPLTLTGANLVRNATNVTISGPGVSLVGKVSVFGNSTLTTYLSIAPNATLGNRQVTVTTPVGTSNALTFTILPVSPSTPTLTSVLPNNGVVGTTVPVTLTGSHFDVGATDVIVSGAGVSVSSINVLNATTLTATFSLSASANLGIHDVMVTTASGTSNAQTFTVTPPPPQAPTLTNVQPNTGVAGNAVGVTLTGTNFVVGATSVNVSGTGITVGTPNVTSTTSLTVTLTIAANAAATVRTVTVTTAGGTSNTQLFTVQVPPPQAPTLTAVQPNTGNPGTSFTATLTGTNFIVNATGVAISGSGVTASAVSVSDPTTLTATFTVNEAATPGSRNVTVTTAGGTSNAQTFTVGLSAPTGNLIPTAGTAGTSVPVTINGTDFVPGNTTVSVSGTGVTVTDVNSTPSTVTGTFNIDPGADLGPQTVSVTTPNGTTGGLPFTIFAPGTQIGTIQPVIGFVGTTVPVIITAQDHFTPGVTTVVTDGGGLTSGPVNVIDPTTLTTTLTIDPDAELGDHIITVTTNDTVIEVIFTVLTPNGPILTTIKPASGVTGSLVPLTLFGANFVRNATKVTVSGPGVSLAGKVSVIGNNILTTYLSIASNATPGNREVTVTTPMGTSNTQTFTILTVSPSTPTLTTVSPDNGIAGTIVPVTLTGSHFVAGATDVIVGGAGVSVSSINVVNSTTLTATFSLSASANLGGHDVVVTTASGTSNLVTFTVNPAPGSNVPTLTNVLPPSGAVGSTFPVILNGSQFVAGATVGVSGTGVHVGTVGVLSPSTITTSFTIDQCTILGSRNVTVTTVGGTSNAQPFTVVMPTPTLTNLTPNSGLLGTTVPVTLTGTNLACGTVLSVSGSGVTVSNVTFGATTVTATLTIDAAAAIGNRNVTVTTPGGTSNALTFTVQASAALQPTLTSVQPNFGNPGTSFTATLTGTNFIVNATSVAISGSGVSATSVIVSGPTSLTATFTVDAAAEPGSRNVTVTTVNGTSNGQTFTVQQPAPTATMSPNVGVAGTSVPVTFTGTDFVPGSTTISISGTGVTIIPGSVTTTSLTATFVIDSGADLGPQTVTLTTPNGTTGGMPFTILPAGTQLGTIQPVIGFVGTTVPVIITGTDHFTPGVTTVVTDGGGLTSGPVNVIDPTTLTTTLTIDPDAELGDHIITVTTDDTVIEVIFTVLTPNGPILTTIKPASGVTGSLVPLTLVGANFVRNQTKVTVTGPGVSLVGKVSVLGNSILTTYLSIASNATPGNRQVTVTTPMGTSNALTFTILPTSPSTPTLTTVSPDNGVAGTSVPVTLTGSHFVAGATDVIVGGAGVSVGSINVLNATTLTATFSLSASANLGGHDVVVTTASGTSNSVTFTVNPAPGTNVPTLTNVLPPSGAVGTTFPVILNGTQFVVGATVGVSGTGVHVGTVGVLSPSTIVTSFTIDACAVPGSRNVTVTTVGGTSNSQPFTVVMPAPTLTNLAPNSGAPGTAVSVTLTGTNLACGTAVSVSGSGVTVSNVTFGATTVTATLTIDAAAAFGNRNVTVTTPSGTSNAQTFTVISANGPKVLTVKPETGLRGTTMSVTLDGNNFVPGSSTVNIDKTGIDITNVVVVDTHTITATFTIAVDAPTGERDVTVTTPFGTSPPAKNFVVPSKTTTTLSPCGPTPTPLCQTTSYGDPVHLAATVVNNDQPLVQPTGTVKFKLYIDTTESESNVLAESDPIPVTNGVAQWPSPDITTLPLGTRLVTATFSPDQNFSDTKTYSSISNPTDQSNQNRAAFVHAVVPDQTTVTLTPCGPSPTPFCQTTLFGDPVHLSAVVKNNNHSQLVPTGSVVFTIYNDTNENAANILAKSDPIPVVNGLAKWPNPAMTTLPVGTRIVTATFIPDANFAGTKTYKSISNPNDISDSNRAAFIHAVIAPAEVCRATPDLLEPPNHKLIPIQVFLDPARVGATGFELISKSSNEADEGLGDGDEPNDIQGWDLNTPDTQGFLRAERSGNADGRTYTLTYRLFNDSGTLCKVQVNVPH